MEIGEEHPGNGEMFAAMQGQIDGLILEFDRILVENARLRAWVDGAVEAWDYDRAAGLALVTVDSLMDGWVAQRRKKAPDHYLRLREEKEATAAWHRRHRPKKGRI